MLASDQQRVAQISGPVDGGRHTRPFGTYLGDLALLGYIEEEFFLSGTAEAYRPLSCGEDGKWTVEPSDHKPFKTRLLVRRPREPATFNGVVVVSWNNVSFGYELLSSCDPKGVYDSGCAWVGVSAQHVGLYGLPPEPHGLKVWDPERYADLVHPGDSFSYDIFAQAGRAVSRDRELAAAGVDPLDGLHVRKLIAVGMSQSGMRLRTFINAIQPRNPVFDAFMPLIEIGAASGFEDFVLDLSRFDDPDAFRQYMGTRARIREDLDVPVMVVNSECEALGIYGARQPDTERFRFWEVAGASHAPLAMLRQVGRLTRRDFGATPAANVGTGGAEPSVVDWEPVFDAALHHMRRWITDGVAPPVQSPIEIAGSPPAVIRDEHGNARGGVRLPDVEAPIARHDGGIWTSEGMRGYGLTGHSRPFDKEKLKALYDNKKAYLARVAASAKAAVRAGVLLPHDAAAYVERAQTIPVPE